MGSGWSLSPGSALDQEPVYPRLLSPITPITPITPIKSVGSEGCCGRQGRALVGG